MKTFKNDNTLSVKVQLPIRAKLLRQWKPISLLPFFSSLATPAHKLHTFPLLSHNAYITNSSCNACNFHHRCIPYLRN